MSDTNLERFVHEITGGSHLRVEDDLGDGFVRLRSEEAERRQAKHDIRGTEDIVIEMLRNARDASATTIFLATSKEGSTRHLTMIDDGDGVPKHLWNRIFDARVTSKLDTVHMDTWGIHGRGMALYAVKMNSEQAYVVNSMLGGGTAIVIETNTSNLSEKTDQSTRPVFVLSDSGVITVRGPRNICRTVTEFAYIDRNKVSVYFGTPIEIAATLWAFGRAVLSPSQIAFSAQVEQLPLPKRLALASSPEEFSAIALTLGLDLSFRSARRIMDGEIEALAPLADDVHIQGKNDARKPAKPKSKAPLQNMLQASDSRTLHIEKDDLEQFAQDISQSFSQLARAYYLDSSVQPELSVRKGAIHIVIPTRMQR